MNRKSTSPIPEAIMQLQRHLDQFRSSQTQRTKLPEALWEAAVELARQHGIYRVAHSLRLDYMGLKKRLGGISAPRIKPGKPTFVELTAPSPTAPLTEYAIDFESPGGRKMRVQWKAATTPDWIGLLRAWREMEG